MKDDYIRREDAIIEMMDNNVDHAQGTDGKEVVQILEDIPAADVVPVVHAYWIRHENADIICGYYVPSFECSQCGTWKEDDSDFCPDCGARMDGGDEA